MENPSGDEFLGVNMLVVLSGWAWNGPSAGVP
jgi:hypothetical protein